MARSTGRQARRARSRVGAAPALPASCAQPPSAYQALHNYAADAGRGSDTFSASDTWRAALLGTVAAGALFFGYGRSARAQVMPGDAQCPVAGGTTVNCTGNLSAGVEVANGAGTLTTLNVNSLTADITPASGVDGINFTSAGNITITSDTTDGPGGPFAIIATGDDAYGIFAQSYGGDVTVASTGDVTSNGSTGIFARSSGAGDVEVTSVGTIQAEQFGLFASSNAGMVTVDSTGDVTSYDSVGILALNYGAGDVYVKSVGGTNGIQAQLDGIFARSSSGDVTVDSTGDVTSYNSRGIDARSVVGDVYVKSVGGANGIEALGTGIYAYSYSGAVTVDSTGDVTSNAGYGIYARSYGAGDVEVTSFGGANGIEALGTGIYAYSYSGAVTVDSTGDVTSNARHGISALGAGDVEVTSVGGVNGIQAQNIGIRAVSDSGAVTVDSTGDVTSDSDRGIFARSNGAGDVEVTSVGGTNGIEAQLDGIFAQSGTGAVTVDSTGDVTSNAGIGISARSFGGSDVNVKSVGGANGIAAQSYGIFALSDVGAATVDSTGDVMSDGSDAIQMRFGTSNTVTLHSGTVHGADDGVEFRGGTTNKLTNYATLSGGFNAVRGSTGYGNETVDNFGTITGNVDLGGGDDAFNNQTGATFNAGATVNLGAGNMLTNDGTLSPRGSGTIGTTVLRGNLVQNAGGILAVDVDMAADTADSIDMTMLGTVTASVAGSVALNFLNLSPLPRTFTLIDTTETIPVQELGVLNPAVLATITYPGDEDVELTITGYDFSAPGLNANQTSIGDNLNGIFGAGGGLGDVLAALANLTSLPSFANALDQLSPEIYGDTQLAALYASLDFSGNLLSCKINGADTAAINREGQCLWAGAKARFLDRDQTFDNIGFDETAGLFAAGAQVALDPVWRLGFGLGYQTSTLDTDTGATSDGDMVQGGVALKYNPGALLLAGVVSGGRGWYDTTRPMAFGAFAATAEGEHEIDVLSGRLHASYVLGAPSLYVKPMVDAAVTRLDLGDVTETGAGAAGLVVNGEETTVFSVSPALELGTEWWLANGTLVRPFVRAGVTWFSDDDVPVSAAFAGAPAGVGPFTIRSEIDEVQADVAAGLEMVNSEDSALRLSYDGHFGEDIEIHSVGFKASARF